MSGLWNRERPYIGAPTVERPLKDRVARETERGAIWHRDGRCLGQLFARQEQIVANLRERADASAPLSALWQLELEEDIRSDEDRRAAGWLKGDTDPTGKALALVPKV